MTATSQAHNTARPLTARIFSTHHRDIARLYFFLSLAAVFVGMALSLLMRIHIIAPELRLPLFGEVHPENYLAWMTMHATLMIFFVLSVAPQNAFGNLVLPEQLGARAMAHPRLNALSFWLTLAAFVVLISAMFTQAGGPIAGWTQYPPLSALSNTGPGQGLGMDLWLISIALFCVASTISAINFLATVLHTRAKGMELMRMPLTVWSWTVTAMLTLLSFSVLFAAALLLFLDRHYGTSFFVPSGLIINGVVENTHSGGSPLLWQHLFWFFGHPEVYIAILPGMGLTSHLLSTFSRRPVFGYRTMAHSILAIGVLGFVVWGHHMFVSGMSPYAGLAFSTLTMVIAVPSSVKVMNWLATLWRGRIRFTAPMLYSIGFVSLFVTGGLTGPVLAQPALDTYLHDTYFVVAHFHMIMGMAAVFALFAATHYWFPLLSSGRMMSERLARWHFWLTFIFAYSTFFPMHFLGLAGHPRRFSQLLGAADSLQSLMALHQWITASAIILASAQLLFVVNLIWSARHGEHASVNPWQATTLEWTVPQDGDIVVHRGAYDIGIARDGSLDYFQQHEASAQDSEKPDAG